MIQKLQPKLTLLIGSAGSGKTQVCTESFEEVLKEALLPVPGCPGTGSNASSSLLAADLLFVLPTAEHRTRVIDLILRRGLGGFFQRRITTFDRALSELLKLGGIDFATDVTRKIILKEIFGRHQFQYFKEAVYTQGFLELISRTIIELKEYLIPPAELKRRFTELKKKFPEFELKYEDLAEIYVAYDEELKKRNLTDLRDSLRLLDEGLARSEFSPPRLKRVWIDGFSDFSKLQLAFIEFLARHADEITVTLTADSDPLRKSLFEIPFQTQAALEDLGFEKKKLGEKNYRVLNETLGHLERNLFRYHEVLKVISDSSIQVFEATGLLGEMEMIAREIKRLVREHRYYFSDIAVLFRATDPYLHVIESVFQKFEIPVEIHERFRLKTHPVARTLQSFLGILLGDWDRKDLFNFLKSGYVHPVRDKLLSQSSGSISITLSTILTGDALKISSGGKRDYELVCELELRALQKGIFRGRACWLQSFPESELFGRIAQLEDQFLVLTSVDGFTRWVKRVMNHFGLLEFPDSTDEKTRRDREGAKRILLLLDEIKAKSKSEGKADPKALTRELLELMEVDLYSIHAHDKNRVQIYNISLARQKEYKAVFLAGLLEKQFPIQVKEDPILSDRERQTLNEHGEVLKEKLPRQAFERYLFYLGTTRARERLILSYPRFNLEGKEALPSFYVEEVRRLFEGELPGKKQLITQTLPSWEEVSIPQEAEERVLWDLWKIPEKSKDEDLVAFGIYNHLIQEPVFCTLIHRALKPIEGIVLDERIRPHFLPKTGMWSPTLVEEYAECPYRFFSNRVLNLESQIEGIDIKRRGTILHDVLEDFFRWKQEKKRVVSFEEASEHAMKKFDDLWQEEPLSGDRYYKIELERKGMQEMILGILRMELVEEKPPISGLVPRYFEYEFRDLVLEGEHRKMVFRGKIDRIDVDPHEHFALVIDYKTGKPFKPSALENGTSLQLPIYLIAIREKLGLKSLGGHLYSLKKTASSGFHHAENLAHAGVSTKKWNHFPEKEFEGILKRAVRFTEKFTEEIEQAKIPVRPRDCVSYCPYSSVCRIEKWRLDYIYREIAEEDVQKFPAPS